MLEFAIYKLFFVYIYIHSSIHVFLHVWFIVIVEVWVVFNVIYLISAAYHYCCCCLQAFVRFNANLEARNQLAFANSNVYCHQYNRTNIA